MAGSIAPTGGFRFRHLPRLPFLRDVGFAFRKPMNPMNSSLRPERLCSRNLRKHLSSCAAWFRRKSVLVLAHVKTLLDQMFCALFWALREVLSSAMIGRAI